MSDLSELTLPNDNTVYSLKDETQTRSDHRHYDSDLVPLVHKVYESTSYYATSQDYEGSSWYFMSVRPDDWYKPWTIKLKFYTYCPNYVGYKSLTYSTISGRADGVIYANWNELNTTAHYYVTVYPLKKVGYDAGFGHAIAISIYGASNYTKSAYYRTFEIDYYSCENCTVTILDTPVKWSAWNGTGSTNYGSITALNAYSRGLQETGDTDTTYTLDRNGENVRLTPSSGTAQNVSLSSLINGLSLGSSPAQTPDYLIAQYAGGGTSNTTYYRRTVGNVVNKTVVDTALGKGSDTTKFYRNDGTWQTIQDEIIKWGGPGINGDLSPIGMALSDEHSANRVAFIDAGALTFEYSSDAGATWTEYTLSDNDKRTFCTKSVDIPIGRPNSSTEVTENSRTRFTLTATKHADDTYTRYVYTNPRKMLVGVSSARTLTMLIETRTGTNYLNNVDTWSTVGTFNISGQTAWNDIPLILGTLGGSSSQTANNWQLRLTFSANVTSTATKTASVVGIRIFGTNAWYTTSNLAKLGHIYDFDINQNVTFPANVSTSGNIAATNLTATKLNNATIGSSPKFTDTTYTFADGTNCFKVTPSGGTQQTVNVTPSIANNVTGSGTSGNLAKFNGTNTLTSTAYSEVTIPNVTSAGSMTTVSVTGTTLNIINGSAPTLGTSIKATKVT